MTPIGGGTRARLAHSTASVSMIVPASINLAPTGQSAPAIWYFIVALSQAVAVPEVQSQQVLKFAYQMGGSRRVVIAAFSSANICSWLSGLV
jgi:hypothetical protein